MAIRPTHLRLDRDLTTVLALRDSPRYAALVRQFRTMFEGRRAIIYGSAPDLVAPAPAAGDLIVCVNASAHNAALAGVAVPDVSFLLGFTLMRTSLAAVKTCEALQGRATKTAILITGAVSLEDCHRSLSDCGYRYEEAHEVRMIERAAIVGDACGEELGFGRLEQKVSTGMFAVSSALLGGSREIVLAGFSFEPGHSYIDLPTRRHHREADMKFLRLCAERGLSLATTSPELANACGLRTVR